eukprot:5364137-Lingulodinium_polyedra.AAC.1
MAAVAALMACERLGALPSLEALLAIRMLLRKRDGGVRPIGLLPGLYRLWAAVRGWVSKAWERGH